MMPPAVPRLSDWVFDWDYAPVAPYTVQWSPLDGSPEQFWQANHIATLTEALQVFFDYGLPARPGYYGKLIDKSSRCVLFWALSDKALAATGGEGIWSGVETVFNEIERLDIGHPVDRAVWEAQARGHAR